jgi:hypothetical protein
MAELLVKRSTNAEQPQTLIADHELPVREGQAGPDLPHRSLVVRGGANFEAWRIGEIVRCRALHALGKIRRRHFDIPVGEIAGVATQGRYQPPRSETSCIRLIFPIPFEAWVDSDSVKARAKKNPRRFPGGGSLSTSRRLNVGP